MTARKNPCGVLKISTPSGTSRRGSRSLHSRGKLRRIFGQIRADVERLGKPVGPLDMLIGAHARAEGLTVVTNNAREFGHLPGGRVENWVDDGSLPE
jgi:predicted nucleic acid-binding protein